MDLQLEVVYRVFAIKGLQIERTDEKYIYCGSRILLVECHSSIHMILRLSSRFLSNKTFSSLVVLISSIFASTLLSLCYLLPL